MHWYTILRSSSSSSSSSTAAAAVVDVSCLEAFLLVRAMETVCLVYIE